MSEQYVGQADVDKWNRGEVVVHLERRTMRDKVVVVATWWSGWGNS